MACLAITRARSPISAPVSGLEIRAGKLTLTDCTVTGGSGEVVTNANGNGTTVTNAAVAISQHTTKKDIDVTITGGTYTATAAVYQTNVQGTGSENVKVSIQSGTFKGAVSAETNNTVAISGGTFSSAVKEEYCAAGYIPTANADGTYGVKEGMEKMPNLPRVAYVQMLQSQGLMHDTYVYGVDAKRTLSTIMNPTEGMDGAILSGNCVSACDKNTTYHHQNNPVVADLFEQHGKTLNYVCNIITNENVYLADKQRSSDWTAKLCRLLDLDGAIVSQEGFGNPDTDLIMNTKKIEQVGVKTTIITDEYAGQDGKSQSLADADPLADAVVTGGNANQVIVLPAMDKVIGTLDYVDKIAGGHAGSLREDGSIEAELQVITGATNEMGFNCLSAR